MLVGDPWGARTLLHSLKTMAEIHKLDGVRVPGGLGISPDCPARVSEPLGGV